MLIGEVVHAFIAWCSRLRALKGRGGLGVSPPSQGGVGGVGSTRPSGSAVTRDVNDRDLAKLTPPEIDEYLADAGQEMSDSTRHHNAAVLERLQQFALEEPVFGKLEKPRVGQRDRVPTVDETAAILSRSSQPFRLI